MIEIVFKFLHSAY